MSISCKPLITIIVPIYNGELYLRKCLNSLIYQTLNNIEIVAVDNGSTDKTREMLEEYEEMYPEKVIAASINHTNGPGGGRNYGLAIARADYIIFADCDDYFDYRAMEIMYKKMISGSYDMVYCANYDVKGEKKKKSRTLKNTKVDYVLQHGSYVFWNKLVKKELYKVLGPIPEEIVFEDIAYVSGLISISKRIGYIDTPLYYYNLRDDSGVNDLHSERMLHSLKAYDYALQKCEKSLRSVLISSIAKRICYDLKKARWTFADYFVEYIKKNMELFETDMVRKDKETYQTLRYIYGLDDTPIPRIVYLNGFTVVDKDRIDNIKRCSFWGNVTLIILDGDNCDIDKNKLVYEAYNNKDYELVASYFALEKIYETGGVYISNKTDITNYLNCLRYYKSFWGYLDAQTVSAHVFGGMKGNKVFLDVKDTFEMKGSFGTLQKCLEDRIKAVFTVKYKIHLDGKYYSDDHVTILPPEILCTDILGEYNICRINQVEKATEEGYIVIKRSTIEAIL